MKIFRFHYRGPYAYIKANWFERRAIRLRMQRKPRTKIVEWPDAPGPKAWGAQFIVFPRGKTE